MELKICEFEGIEVKQEATHLYVEGYAAVYGNVDSYKDIIQAGAFTNFLVSPDDVKRCKFCYNHNLADVIGVIEEIKSDDKGLWFRAKISNTTRGKDIAELVADKALTEFSIGYKTVNSIYKDDGVRLLTEVYLYEISIVSRAANPKAVITETERKDEETDEDVKEEIKEEKLSLKDMDYAQLQCELDGLESRKAEVLAEMDARIINAINLK